MAIEMLNGGREDLLREMSLREMGRLLQSIRPVRMNDDHLVESVGSPQSEGDSDFDILRDLILNPDDEHYLGNEIRFYRDINNRMHLVLEVPDLRPCPRCQLVPGNWMLGLRALTYEKSLWWSASEVVDRQASHAASQASFIEGLLFDRFRPQRDRVAVIRDTASEAISHLNVIGEALLSATAAMSEPVTLLDAPEYSDRSADRDWLNRPVWEIRKPDVPADWDPGVFPSHPIYPQGQGSPARLLAHLFRALYVLPPMQYDDSLLHVEGLGQDPQVDMLMGAYLYLYAPKIDPVMRYEAAKRTVIRLAGTPPREVYRWLRTYFETLTTPERIARASAA